MKKNKTEILSGIHPVFEALKANRRKFYKLFLKKSFKKPNLKRSEFDEIFKITKIYFYVCIIINKLQMIIDK